MKISLMLSAVMLRPGMAFVPAPGRHLYTTTSLLAEKLPVMAEEEIMSPKAHGTSVKPVQKELRWNCDFNTADRICNFNRKYELYGKPVFSSPHMIL